MDPISIALALAQFAPSIMKYMGAGSSSVDTAQKVVDIAQNLTGAADPQEALAAIRAKAELAQAFNLAVLAADTDLEKAYLTDRQSARARDIAYVTSGRTNKRADLMVLCDVVGLIACLVVLSLFRKDIPGEVVGLLSSVASIFGLCLRDAHQFEFGSSRGSRDKDDLLAGIQKPQATK
ncbi:hypothetical protein [Rhodoferax sp. BLA1]|uniref:hypothetical protein n=1 Tax=Rhodoferax sp. BLA1 TaxID=2576062 RepID=UPI0015D14892|nr:hypothetical protein [Rhodoferax sp. BLA1]